MEDTRTADAGQRRRPGGRGQDQAARRGAPTGAQAPPEGVRSPDDPRGDRSGGQGEHHSGAGSSPLYCGTNYRRRQKKVWMPANSGSGQWASLGSQHQALLEAVELCAGKRPPQLYFNIIFLPGEMGGFGFVTSLSRV